MIVLYIFLSIAAYKAECTITPPHTTSAKATAVEESYGAQECDATTAAQ